MKSDKNNSRQDKAVLETIQDIKNGVLNPALLDKERRQLCVQALYLEGIGTCQVAQVLKVNDRTVRRDLCEIRQKNALAPTPELAKQIVGDFLLTETAHRTHLMRLARGKDGSVGERAQAEYYAHMVTRDMAMMLQSLGYLSKAPESLALTHYVRKDTPDADIIEITQELCDMEQLETDVAKKKTLGKLKESLTERKE